MKVKIEKMTVVKSNVEDHEVLTDITKKSKAYWGYSVRQIEKWSEQLTITKDYIETHKVFKFLIDNKIIGYYAYYYSEGNMVKLDNLFVLPEFIGRGIGKRLMNDFIDRIKNTETQKIILDSEPNAREFYEKFGFIKVGKLETSIKDRYLPIMELELK